MRKDQTQIGPFTLTPIETGRFRLDGGAMFGVVPKTLWSRKIDADDKNRILMATRCLLIQSDNTDKVYLIDNGCGTKFDEKMSNIYSLDYNHSSLTDSLNKAGIKPEEITDIIFSHLHFDHCGGTTFYNDDDEIVHQFQNATYHVNKNHWKTATRPNQREKASFLPENIKPIGDSNRLHLVDDYHMFEPGLQTLLVNGHTIGQQLPVISSGEIKLVYAADLFPTAVHVPLPWVMGYDMYPVQTLSEKEDILKQAVEQNWYFFMEHDALNEVITIEEDQGRFQMKKSLKLSDIS